MEPEQRQALIAQYRDGYRAVADALAGATEQDLDARPAPGKWSVREIVHHLADSEMTSAIRLRLLVAGPNAAIASYDQDQFARTLYYDRPIATSLEALRVARQSTVEILERMSEADWRSEGTHPEHGRYTVLRWLEIYAAHAHAHAQQIVAARRAATSPESA